MPQFTLTLDMSGFTTDEALTEQWLSSQAAGEYTQKLKDANALPKGVLKILGASVSPDAEEFGEWKVFATVKLLVTATSEEEAKSMAIPYDFFYNVVSGMIGHDAEGAYGFDGCQEVLECEEAVDGLNLNSR